MTPIIIPAKEIDWTISIDKILQDLHQEAIQTDEENYNHTCNYCFDRSTDEPCTNCKKTICKRHTHLLIVGAGEKVKVCPTCYAKSDNWSTPPEDEEGPTNV